MKKCLVELPAFELLKRQPHAPHVSRVVVEREIPNEYGTPIKFTVEQSRRGKDWWIHASREGFRMSGTVHTTKAEKAEAWIKAVRSGRICVKKDKLGL